MPRFATAMTCLMALTALPAMAHALRFGGADAGAAVLRIAQNEPRGMAFEVYIRLKTGMTEAELLERAGPPDYESVEGTTTRSQAIVRDSVVADPATGQAVPQKNVTKSQSTEVVKSWYYLPTIADPFTTHITLVGGRIADIERTKKF